MRQVHRRVLLPKQMDFVTWNGGPHHNPDTDGVPHIIYSGAFAAGKTRALCEKLFARACVPGARELLIRRHLADLRSSTLRTLLEPEGTMQPVIPRGCYTHNKNERIISINGGGQIYYFGAHDANAGSKGGQHKSGSVQGTGAAIDEWSELTEKETRWLGSRVRLEATGLTRVVYGATNPGAPTHFLARWFGIGGHCNPLPSHRSIMTRSLDNTFLPRDYVAMLDTYTGVMRERYVEGRWVGSDGNVYAHWDARIHVVRHDDDAVWDRIVVGVDDGTMNPFAAYVCAFDGDGRMHVLREHQESRMSLDDKLRVLSEFADGAEAVTIDPSAAGLIMECVNRGLPAVAANNNVLFGISRVDNRMVPQIDGRVRLTVDPSCTALIKQFDSYEWRSGADRDAPKKTNDHGPDAVRYAAMHVDAEQRYMVEVW